MGRTLRLVLGLLLVAAFQPAVAQAATLVVDDTLACPGATFLTIQAAVNAANNGDTIEVCDGLYPELLSPGPLTINKSVTLLGAQAGVDARSRVGPESVITDPQGTSVTVSNVVIDGFTVKNSVVAAFTGQGIFLSPGISGTAILNNIIEDNILGIGLANNGAQAVIRHNLIRNNTRPGGASGSGIYTDQFSGGPIVRNVLIDENDFVGHAGFGAAINISNTNPAGGVFDLTVTSNRFVTNSRAFLLFNTHNSLFDGNTVTGSTFVASADVRLFDNNTNLLFTNNNFRSGVGHAIRLSPPIVGLPPSSNVDFHQNNIEFYGLTGLTVDPLSHVGTVDAECNWWNSPSGPFNVLTNPTGTGEEVVGDADFTPWLTAPAPGGRCLGGIPSTAGKVTGGGQTTGDPLFSPLGDLLSLPALIPSLSDPGAQATFGFNVRCCPEAGNLTYHDHQADVKIKAISFDLLNISDGICGTNTHALFAGEANVTRSTGTTTESLTVEVDDCDEPGRMDTFGIETDTYSKPPTPLTGGNIQIHK